jgi:hypothetical protein
MVSKPVDDHIDLGCIWKSSLFTDAVEYEYVPISTSIFSKYEAEDQKLDLLKDLEPRETKEYPYEAENSPFENPEQPRIDKIDAMDDKIIPEKVLKQDSGTCLLVPKVENIETKSEAKPSSQSKKSVSFGVIFISLSQCS